MAENNPNGAELNSGIASPASGNNDTIIMSKNGVISVPKYGKVRKRKRITKPVNTSN